MWEKSLSIVHVQFAAPVDIYSILKTTLLTGLHLNLKHMLVFEQNINHRAISL